MKLTLAVLLALLLAQPALACRGPFSAPYAIHIEDHHVIYSGTVVSVEARTMERGTPREYQTTFTTLKVKRAWQPGPPATIVVAGLHSQVGDLQACVRSEYPKPGENWLVVGHKRGGVVAQSDVMGFNVTDRRYQRDVRLVVEKTRPKHYGPAQPGG